MMCGMYDMVLILVEVRVSIFKKYHKKIVSCINIRVYAVHTLHFFILI